MMYNRRSTQAEHGSVAVEFALTFPIILIALYITASLGFVLWARYQLLGYASAAARTCAMATPANLNTQNSCVESYINVAMQQLAVPCNGVTIKADNTQLMSNNVNMHLLSIQVSCVAPMFANMTSMAYDGGEFQGLASMPISVAASMPFLVQKY